MSEQNKDDSGKLVEKFKTLANETKIEFLTPLANKGYYAGVKSFPADAELTLFIDVKRNSDGLLEIKRSKDRGTPNTSLSFKAPFTIIDNPE